MAYCPPEMLDDLRDVLSAVRGWSGIIEKKPGVFYVGSQPFLHFHLLREGRRRADIKGCTEWIHIDLPHPLSAARRRAFLRDLRARYAEKPNKRATRARVATSTPVVDGR
jgi:hypothetical protein